MYLLISVLPHLILLSKVADYDIETTRESLQVENKQQVLLAFAWMTGVELNLLKRFPEFLAGDVTERTNREKRGLFLLTGKDGNNRTFIAFHCYLPNSKTDTFDWLYRTAIPHLAGEKVILRNQVFLSDGEDALFSPFVNLTQLDSPWKNSKHYRCSYHLITQEWATHVAGKIKKTELGVEKVEQIRLWINSLIHRVETTYQYNDSVAKLSEFIEASRGDIGESAHMQIKRIFFRSMHPISSTWAKSSSVGRMDLCQSTSSFCERCNRGLKEKHVALSLLNIDKSAEVAVDHSSDINTKISM